MSSNVVRLNERKAAAQVEDYLGPAVVDRVEGSEVYVHPASGGRPVRAEWRWPSRTRLPKATRCS